MHKETCNSLMLALLCLSLWCGSARGAPELWCASGAGGRYDSETGERLGAFTQGEEYFGVYGFTLGNDGYTYAAGWSDGWAVARFDSATYEFHDYFVDHGAGGLVYPAGTTFGPDGNLYVASWSTDNVLRYDGKTGAFMGVFASVGIDGPEGIAFGPDENLYVSSRLTDEVLRFDGTSGEPLGVFAAGDTIDAPVELCFRDNGRLYVSNLFSGVAMFDDASGESLGFLVERWSGGLSEASGFDFGADGNIYVVDEGYQRVLRYDGTTGEFIDVFIDGPIGDVGVMHFVAPEPTSLLLLAAGGVILLRRRR